MNSMPLSAESSQRDIEFRVSDPVRQDAQVRDFLLHSTWGLFSPKALDEGSRLLLEHVRVSQTDMILDIGCGYGPLGLMLAARAPQGMAHLVDKDFVAIEYAKKNAQLNNIENVSIYLSNGLRDVPRAIMFNCIVSNLPGKVGRELLHILIFDSYNRLKPGGQLCVVTINGIREFIKKEFEVVLGNYEKLKQGRRYTVSRAVKQS